MNVVLYIHILSHEQLEKCYNLKYRDFIMALNKIGVDSLM